MIAHVAVLAAPTYATHRQRRPGRRPSGKSNRRNVPVESDRRRPHREGERGGDVCRRAATPDGAGSHSRRSPSTPARSAHPASDRKQDPADEVGRLPRGDDDPGDRERQQHDRDAIVMTRSAPPFPRLSGILEVAGGPGRHDRHHPEDGGRGEDGPSPHSRSPPSERSLAVDRASHTAFSIFHRVGMARDRSRPAGSGNDLRRLRKPGGDAGARQRSGDARGGADAGIGPLEPGVRRRVRRRERRSAASTMLAWSRPTPVVSARRLRRPPGLSGLPGCPA